MDQLINEIPYPSQHYFYLPIKRFLDVSLCLLILPLALIPMIVIGLLIMFDSPGPALFIQERIGKNGERFRIFKYRTMQHRADNTHANAFMQAFVNGEVDCQQGAIFKPPQSPQKITRIGCILRKTSMDELPQIFNVLRGDMSLIGPRPNMPCEVEVYKEWHKRRLQVAPGITGLAQINGRSSIPFDQIVKYDLEYIENLSLWLDLKILVQTFLIVCLRKGAL
ncbi:MAG: sugar transferase [Anaerolineae bacterium]|nr:sugar transferase [Anaerolineae bacterium]